MGKRAALIPRLITLIAVLVVISIFDKIKSGSQIRVSYESDIANNFDASSRVLSSSQSASTSTDSSSMMNYILTFIYAFGTFLSLNILCEEFLCPAIDDICELQQIPDDVAAATLVALGSSAPEIAINVVATANGKVDLSLPAIFGSCIIALGFIPSLCVLSIGKALKLETWPLARDCTMLCISFALLWNSLSDGIIDQREAERLVSIYLVYLAILLVPHIVLVVQGKNRRTTTKNLYDDIEEKNEEHATNGTTDICNDESEKSIFSKFVDLCSIPIRKIFSITIPMQAEDDNPSLFTTALSIFFSLVWIAIISAIALTVAQFAADTFGMSKVTAGFTVLAVGGQIPDTLSSITLADTMPAGAVANAVGSQVANVSLAVGLPFFVYNIVLGKGIYVGEENATMIKLAELMMVVVVAFLLVTFPIVGWISGRTSFANSRLDVIGAVILFGTAFLCYAIFCYSQLHAT